MLDWIENKFLAKELSFLLFPLYKLSLENTQLENMCDTVLEKTKSHGGIVNRTSIYAEAAVQKVLLKTCYEKFGRLHQETSAQEYLFW